MSCFVWCGFGINNFAGCYFELGQRELCFDVFGRWCFGFSIGVVLVEGVWFGGLRLLAGFVGLFGVI